MDNKKDQNIAIGVVEMRLKELISWREWITACASRDLSQFGEWRCDWALLQGDIKRDIDRLMTVFNLKEKDNGQ